MGECFSPEKGMKVTIAKIGRKQFSSGYGLFLTAVMQNKAEPEKREHWVAWSGELPEVVPAKRRGRNYEGMFSHAKENS
jgi:hypothetical protein